MVVLLREYNQLLIRNHIVQVKNNNLLVQSIFKAGDKPDNNVFK